MHEGRCKGSYTPLLKEVVGVPGDVVEYRDAYSVNGVVLPNSKVLSEGAAEYQQTLKRRFIVPEGKVWLMGLYSPLSFDSRYFGVMESRRIIGIALKVDAL